MHAKLRIRAFFLVFVFEKKKFFEAVNVFCLSSTNGDEWVYFDRSIPTKINYQRKRWVWMEKKENYWRDWFILIIVCVHFSSFFSTIQWMGVFWSDFLVTSYDCEEVELIEMCLFACSYHVRSFWNRNLHCFFGFGFWFSFKHCITNMQWDWLTLFANNVDENSVGAKM